MQLKDKTLSTLITTYNRLFSPNEKLLVGFSGGVDSCVLLETLVKLRPDLEIFAAHCNHKLRESADEDELFCRKKADQLGVSFISESVYVDDFSKVNKMGTEEAARILRHYFFYNMKKEHGIDKLVLGHHANDRAETVLFNILRGAGLGGISAMKEFDIRKNIVRPLMGLEKPQIKEFATSNEIAWVEDHTNAESEYDRNWLRNDILPQIQERKSGIVKVLTRSADYFEKIADFMKEQALAFIQNNIKESNNKITFFSLEEYRKQHSALKNEIILQLWVSLYGSSSHFSNKVLREVNRWIEKDLNNGRTTSFGNDFRLVNRNGNLGFISHKDENIQKINDKLITSFMSNEIEKNEPAQSEYKL